VANYVVLFPLSIITTEKGLIPSSKLSMLFPTSFTSMIYFAKLARRVELTGLPFPFLPNLCSQIDQSKGSVQVLRPDRQIVHPLKRPFANQGFTPGRIHGEAFLPLLDDIPHAIIQLMKGYTMSVCSSFAKTGYMSSKSCLSVSLLPMNSLMYLGGTYIVFGYLYQLSLI
jgi:hypothetical protein